MSSEGEGQIEGAEARDGFAGQCPHCGKTVKLTKNRSGKWVAGISGLTVGGIIGGLIGAGVGIASSGWGMAGTIPAGIALGGILGGTSYVVGDQLTDSFKCPACTEEIKF